jgi:hypothetical protein
MFFWLKDWKDEEIARLNEIIQQLLDHIKEIGEIVKSANKS